MHTHTKYKASSILACAYFCFKPLLSPVELNNYFVLHVTSKENHNQPECSVCCNPPAAR